MTTTTTAAKPVVPMGALPVGTVLLYGAPVNAALLEQQGWLYCDGRTISRSTYAELFAVIGTLHGGGDATTTYNLPDYRGYFVRGVDDGTGRDPGAAQRQAAAAGGMPGDQCGSVQGYATGNPATAYTMSTDGDHNHQIQHIPDDNSSYAMAGSYQAIWNGGSANTSSAGDHTHTIAGGDAETRPLNAYVNGLIKYTAGPA